MTDSCERRDVEWLEKMVRQMLYDHDAKLLERFKGQEMALKIAQDNNQHWKTEAELWLKRADERERNFFSRTGGYVVVMISIVTFSLSIYSYVHNL